MRLQKLSRIILSPAQSPKHKKSRTSFPSLVLQEKWYIETNNIHRVLFEFFVPWQQLIICRNVEIFPLNFLL
jgi:hypothetical protein